MMRQRLTHSTGHISQGADMTEFLDVPGGRIAYDVDGVG